MESQYLKFADGIVVLLAKQVGWCWFVRDDPQEFFNHSKFNPLSVQVSATRC